MHGHVVETLAHRCAFANADLALRTQSKLSEFLQGPARRVMADVLDQFSVASEVWSIDELEIDLGVLYAHESIDDWAQSLATQLAEQLRQKSLTRSPGGGSVSGEVKWTNAKHSQREAYAQTERWTSHTDRELASLLDYLERGYLDWSRSLPGGFDVVAWCSTIIEKNGPQLLASIHARGTQSPAALRLVANASSRSLRLLLQNEVPELARVLDLRLGQLRTEPSVNDARRTSLESTWLGLCLRLLGGEQGLAAESRRESNATIQQRLSSTLLEALGYAGVSVATPTPGRITTGTPRRPQSLYGVQSPRTAVAFDNGLDVAGCIQALMALPGTACSRALLRTLGVDDSKQNVTTLNQCWGRLHSALVAAEPTYRRALPGLLSGICARHPQWIGHTLRLWALHRAIRRQWVEQLDAESLGAILEVLMGTQMQSQRRGKASLGRDLPSRQRLAAGHVEPSLSVKVGFTNELSTTLGGETPVAAKALVTSGEEMFVETNVGDTISGDESSMGNVDQRQRLAQLLEIAIRRLIQGGPQRSSDAQWSHACQQVIAQLQGLDGFADAAPDAVSRASLSGTDDAAGTSIGKQSNRLPTLSKKIGERTSEGHVTLPANTCVPSVMQHAPSANIVAPTNVHAWPPLLNRGQLPASKINSQPTHHAPPLAHTAKRLGDSERELIAWSPCINSENQVRIHASSPRFAEHCITSSVQESSNHEETTADIRARLSQARSTLHEALILGRDYDSQSITSALRLLRKRAPHWLRYTLRVWGAKRMGYRTWATTYGPEIVWNLLDALDVTSSFDVASDAAASSNNAQHDEAAGRATAFTGNASSCESSTKAASDSRRTTQADCHVESSPAVMLTSVSVAQDERQVEVPCAAVGAVPNFTQSVGSVPNPRTVATVAEISDSKVRRVEAFERAMSRADQLLRTQGRQDESFYAAQLRTQLLECALQLAVQGPEWSRFSDWEDFWDTVTTILSARLQSDTRTIPTDATSADLSVASLALDSTMRSQALHDPTRSWSTWRERQGAADGPCSQASPCSIEGGLSAQSSRCSDITGTELASAHGGFAKWWLDHSAESRPVTVTPGRESQPELHDDEGHTSPMQYSRDTRSALPPDTDVAVVTVTPSSTRLDEHMPSKPVLVIHSESNDTRDALDRAGDSLACGANPSVHALSRAAAPPLHRAQRSWRDFCSAEFAARLGVGLDPLDRLELADAMSDPRACQGWIASTSEGQRWALLSAFLPESSGVLRELMQSLQRAAMRMLAETSVNSPVSLNPYEMHWRFIAKHVFLEGLDAEPAVLAHRYSLYLVPFVRGSESERDPLELLQWVRKQLAKALLNDRVDSAVARESESQLLANKGDSHQAMLRALDALPTPSEAWEASYGATAPIDNVPESYTDAADIGSERDPLYVGNAGLVLLAPFLERLFAHQRLTHEQKFVNIAARFRAVHLMEHLVHGHTNTCEPAWVLNKLLCGLPFATPVPRCDGLDEATSAVLDDLLHAVIQHWNALGKTSIAGLQETFLRREGRLTRAENSTPAGWHLKIEDKCFDVLLDRIPWGISLIKLPWMEGVLNVEWH